MRSFFFQSNTVSVDELEIITAKDATIIKQKIGRLAQCRKTKTTKIHTEIKRKFNYLSYQMINRYTCKNLNLYLDGQIKVDCSRSPEEK